MKTIIPSGLAQVLSRLRERWEVRRAGSEWRTRCPAHDDNGPSLYVGLSQDRTCILLNCKAGCDAHDIVAALGLEVGDLFLHGDTQVEVNGEFDVVEESPAETDPRPTADPGPGNCCKASKAGPETCDQIYRELLALLSLSANHREDLRRRGLDDTAIEQCGYKTAARYAVHQAVGKLKKTHDNEALLQVPGFRLKRGRVRFTDIEGLLVPVRDRAGRVIALKIRPDAIQDGPKYLWISSAEDGPSPGSPPHVPLGTPQQAPEVRLTEGELKSDIGWRKSNLPTVGVSGVSNWRTCVDVLKALSAQAVRVAFDQDDPPRSGVVRDLRACAEGLRKEGFEVKLERWDSQGGKFKGIDDLLVAGREPQVLTGKAVFQAINQMVSAAGPDEEDWLPADSSEEVEPFPLDCLPGPLRQFATEAATSYQCPLDLVAVPMLAVAATAIGASRSLELRPGYEEVPRFYGAVVARTGTAKSPAMRAACAPLYAAQKRLKQKCHLAKEQYTKDMEAYEAARKAPKKTEEGVASIPSKPTKPTMAHVWVADVTTEALAPLLDRNPRGLLMVRDELTGWVLSHNQYRGGRGADRQFYLSCWSGEPAKVDRKSDQGESLVVDDPFLCVIGCLPPSKLAVLDAENDCEDGFVHRVLFSFPGPVSGRRWNWKGLSAERQQAWKEAVDKLRALQVDKDEDGSPVPVKVHFVEEARQLWEQWYNAHFQETEAPDFPDALVGPWSKLVAYAARLALILHLLRTVCGEVDAEDVDAESLRRAIQLIGYFKSHARVVYARLQHSPAVKRVQQAITWIRGHSGECNPTHLVRNNVAGITKKTEAEAMMRELEDRGYGHCEPRKARNNRTVTWFVAKTANRVQSGPVG